MADQFDYRMLAKGVTPIDLPNPIQNALGAQQVAGAQTANALNGIKLQNDQRAMGIQSELDNFDGTDPTKLSRPAQKQFATEQSAQKLAALDSHMKIIEAGTQLAQGATNQAEWDQFRQQMAQFDPKAAANIDPLFTPEKRDAFVVKGLSVKDSFANQMKMMELQSRDADRQEMMNYRRDMVRVARMNAGANQQRANTATAKGGFITDEDGNVVRDPSSANDIQFWANKVAGGDSNLARVPAGLKVQVMSEVGKINPNWSEQTFGMKQKTLKDFVSGVQGNSMRNIATAHDHLDMLIPLHQAMNTGDIQLINKIATNFGAAKGDTPEQTYDNIKMMVAGEVAKGIKGSGVPTEYEIKSIADGFDKKSSQEQLESTINGMKQMMGVQHENLYSQGTAGGLKENDFPSYSRKIHSMYAGNGANSSPSASNVSSIPMSVIRQAAQSEGVSIEQAMQDAIDQGHSIYGD